MYIYFQWFERTVPPAVFRDFPRYGDWYPSMLPLIVMGAVVLGRPFPSAPGGDWDCDNSCS